MTNSNLTTRITEAEAAEAARRLALITPDPNGGYAGAVMIAYGCLPKGQLYRDLDTLIAVARDYARKEG